MAFDKKKIAAVMAAVNLYMEEEQEGSLYIPQMPKAEKGESPWVRFGRVNAMLVRNQCQQRLFK